MVILNGKRYEKSFRQVVEQAISGILPKENALNLLESRYKYFQDCISTNEQKPWFDIQNEEGKSRRTDSGEYEDDTGQYKPLIELHERQKKELAREYNSYRSEIAALGYANGDKQKNIVNNGTIENPEATEPQIILPSNNNLEELTKGKTPVLRTWKNGKYICPNLPAFITAYIKTVDDLTHAMIRDYLICEKTKKPFTNKTINQQMKIYGPGRRSKTVIPR